MGANRLPPPPRPALWAVADDAPAVAHAYPPAKLALFRAPSFAPEHVKLPILPSRLSLAAAESPSDPPSVLISTARGHIYLSNRLLLRLPSPPSALVHDCRNAIAVSARTLTVIPVASPNEHTNVAHVHAVPPTAALLLDRERVILASQQITLHELPSARLVARFAGHASPVTSLARLSSKAFVSAAARERILLVWRLQSQSTTQRKRRRLPPVAPALSLAAPKAGVRALISDKHSNGAHLAAIVGSQEVVVWRGLPGSAKTPVECSFLIRSPNAPILSVLFAEEARLTVLYGQGAKPQVYIVDVAKVSTDLIELPSAPLALITADAQTKPNAKVQLVKQAVALQSSSVPAVPAASKRKHGNEDDDDEPLDGLDEELDAPERSTIQEKLASLGVTPDTPRPSIPNIPVLESTRLDSRVVILSQAIRVQDDFMFDRIIDSTQDITTIRNTVEEMSPDMATGALLSMLVDRLERQPRRVHSFLKWIKTVLIEHAGTFVGQQENRTLHLLGAIIDARTQNLEALARLEGRLELVVGQAQRQKRLKQFKTSKMPAGLEYTYDPSHVAQDNENDGTVNESSEGESDSGSDIEDAEDTGDTSGSESEPGDHGVEKGAAQGNGDVRMNGIENGSALEESADSEQNSEDDGD